MITEMNVLGFKITKILTLHLEGGKMKSYVTFEQPEGAKGTLYFTAKDIDSVLIAKDNENSTQ